MLRSLRIGGIVFRQLFPVICLCLAVSCSQSSPTVLVSPAEGSITGNDTGTMYPMIQSVYPGTLQSLDIPYAVQYGVSAASPGICIVFTLPMANVSVELVDDTYPDVLIPVYLGSSLNADSFSNPGVSVYPSTWFLVIPAYSSGVEFGQLKPDTPYTLRIYKSSYAQSVVQIASVSRSGNVATVVTSTGHDLSTNQLVSVAGVTSAAGFNTASPVLVTVVNTTTFTYADAASNLATTLTPETTALVSSFNRTLIFSNLVEAPATTISPADPEYVEYKFVTGDE
jgi:hypothetical protein